MSDPIEAARAALQSGDLIGARQEAERAIRMTPARADAWIVHAETELRFGAWNTAISALDQAAALGAAASETTYYRGQALYGQGDPAAALIQFDRVLAAIPDHAPSRFKRIDCIRACGDIDAAGREALLAARDPALIRRALPLVLRFAAHLAQLGTTPPSGMEPARTGPNDFISIVVCSIDPSRFARLSENLSQQFGGTPWELILISDARSLCEGFNRGFAQCRGEFIVFCHDDIELIAMDFRARLLAHLSQYDVVGVAGTTRLTAPMWFGSGPPHIHYWVTHRLDGGALSAGICGARGPVVDAAQGLDGVFIAARRSAVALLGFDQETFDGFHLYDLDFSYRAHLAGLRVAIALDLLLIHDSAGKYSTEYWRYAERLCRKFPRLATEPAPPQEPIFHGALLQNVEQIRALYGWIERWARGQGKEHR